MRTSRFGIGIAAVVLAALTLGACGSDDAPGAAEAPEDSGPPIKIFAITSEGGPAGTPNFPEGRIGLEAAVAAINERGGIKGRLLELSTCPDKQDQNAAAACARQAVKEDAVAIVGMSSRFAAAYQPVLSAAGIPNIGLNISTPSIEAVDPLSYPLTIGSASGPAGAAALFADVLKGKKLVTGYIDVASAAESVKLMDVVLGARGLEQVKVPLPVSAPDYSSHAAALLRNKPDVVYMAHIASEADKLTVALRQSGFDGTIIRSGSVTPESSVKTLGAAAEGMYITAEFLPTTSDDPGVKQFIAEVDRQDRNAAKTDSMKRSYAAVYLFAEAAEAATSITREAIMASLESGETFDVPMLPPVQFKTVTKLAPFPRYFNTGVTFAVVKGGEIVTGNDDSFVDAFRDPSTDS